MSNTVKILTSHYFETPLGTMFAIADEAALYLLEFTERVRLDSEVANLTKKSRATLISGITSPIHSIQEELKHYFAGNLKVFKTPILMHGTAFQKEAWEQLNRIPYGETHSYAEQAKAIGKPKAFRAVAKANSTNQLAIIVPCHRIINTSGELGGYAAGLTRKKWLLDHEKKFQ